MRQSKLRFTIIMLFVLCLLLPSGALAYSYGDPNKEDIAESFKEIVVELNQSPIDWAKAKAIYKTRRAELSSHFGEDITVTLDVNLSDENKDGFIANFKAVLGLNLKRRFDYALKDFDDYAAAKLLVAKAKGTYDVMKPYLPSSKTSGLDTAFEVAYVALGNPGLFGVGEKPSDEAEFKKQSSLILDTIIPLVPYTEAKVIVDEPIAEKPIAEKPIVKPTSEPEKLPADAIKEEQEEQQIVDNEEITPIVEVPIVVEPEVDNAVQEAEDVEDPLVTDTEPNLDAENQTVEDEAAIEHAPMERTKKTNPLISIIVISAIIAIIGTTVWILRKKKLI